MDMHESETVTRSKNDRCPVSIFKKRLDFQKVFSVSSLCVLNQILNRRNVEKDLLLS